MFSRRVFFRVLLGFATVVGLYILFTAIRDARQEARDAAGIGRMASVLKAFELYHAEYGRFPDAVSRSTAGELYSWRIEILPYLGSYQDVYDQYRFDEPWDGPHNKKLASKMPDEYRCTTESYDSRTGYVVVTGPGSLFPDGGPVNAAKVLDKPNETVVVLEGTSYTVPWMQPRDIPIEKAPVIIRSGIENRALRAHEPGVLVGYADWRVRYLRNATSRKSILAVLTPDGGEKVESSILGRWTQRQNAPFSVRGCFNG